MIITQIIDDNPSNFIGSGPIFSFAATKFKLTVAFAPPLITIRIYKLILLLDQRSSLLKIGGKYEEVINVFYVGCSAGGVWSW